MLCADWTTAPRLSAAKSPLEYPISNWQTREIFLISRTISPRCISLAGACHLINQLEQCKRWSWGRAVSHAQRATRSSAAAARRRPLNATHLPLFHSSLVHLVWSEAASSCGSRPGRSFSCQIQTCLRSKRRWKSGASRWLTCWRKPRAGDHSSCGSTRPSGIMET